MPSVITATKPELLTYDAYLAEGEITQRYDIIDGERTFMPGATRQHQKYVQRITRALEDYEVQSGRGSTYFAPCDVLIRRDPLRTRQPDVMLIGTERNLQNPPPTDPAPLSPAPELVVEVISDSETEARFESKVADYCLVDVRECWAVRPQSKTVEVFRLSAVGSELIATHRIEETVKSLTFEGLEISVAAIFAE